MFNYDCVIRKNNPKLLGKLSDLGYKLSNTITTEYRSYGILCNKKVAIGIPKDSEEFILDSYLKIHSHIIDCKDNEKLFLAVAAIRDDDDYMQYFTNGDIFIQCNRFNWLDMCCILYNEGYTAAELSSFHKATVEELLSHFLNT